jgi:hypothetical protein
MPELKEVFEMVSQKVEPDLDAWKQQEQRQRRTARNRKIGAFALVACLLIAAVVIAVNARPAEEQTNVGDTSGPAVDGAAPTLETVRGIWLFDGGPDPGEPGMLMRLAPDGSFAIDAYGSLDVSPATLGTFAIDGGHVDFEVGPSARCPNGETFTLLMGVSSDGRLDTVMTEPGCGVAKGTRWAWTRVSPASEASTEIRAAAPSGDAAPPEDAGSLEGIWLLEGTGQLLRVSFSGSYSMDDQGSLGGDPSDVGLVEVRGRRVVLVSGSASRTCASSARWVWGEVKLEPFGTRMRAVSRSDACGRGVAEGDGLTWIRISAP